MMAFEIELENSDDVTPECLARAIDTVVHELEGRLIYSIYFDENFLAVVLCDKTHLIDFKVQRTGVHHAY